MTHRGGNRTSAPSVRFSCFRSWFLSSLPFPLALALCYVPFTLLAPGSRSPLGSAFPSRTPFAFRASLAFSFVHSFPFLFYVLYTRESILSLSLPSVASLLTPLLFSFDVVNPLLLWTSSSLSDSLSRVRGQPRLRHAYAAAFGIGVCQPNHRRET